MSMQNYRKIKSLGKGSFGQAWLVLSKSDRSRYVAKVMQEFQTEEEKADCFKEARVLRSLKHPNIVRYVDSFAENEKFHIVMEFVDGGDLAQLIQRQRRTRKYLPEARVAHVFWQICLGVNHCHKNRILHRDIKSGNIFLMKDGGVKVGDFGIARVLDSTTALARTKIGTPYYLSPEICQEKPYNQKSDVWALGCLLYEMLALEVPFKAKDIMNLMRMIMFRHPQPIRGGNYSSSMRNLVKSLLAKDPKRRPSVRQILTHPLFRKFEREKKVERRANDVTNDQHESQHVKNSEITSAEATRYFEKLAQLRLGAHRKNVNVTRHHSRVAQHPKQEKVRCRSLKQENEEHLKQLAKARQQAFDERMALKKKMAGVGGRPQEQHRRHHTIAPPPPPAVQQHRQQQPRDLQSVKQRQRKSVLEKKEEELLRQLAEARKQAFEERMKLKEKMAGVGGRPSSNNDTQSRIHNTPPEERRKNREVDREQRRKSLENEKLRELREARVQAYEARMALKKKMEGIGGRPVSTVTKKVIVMNESEKTSLSNNTKNKENISNAKDTYLAELAKARKRAFEERLALKKKFQGVGGRPDTSPPAPPAIPMPVAKQSHESRKQKTEQKRRVEESAKLKLLADARKRAFEERMALVKKMQGVGGRPSPSPSSSAASATLAKRNVTRREESRQQEEARQLSLLSKARKEAFQERMALKEKMENIKLSKSPQEILKQKVKLARTVVKEQKENIKQFRTPTNFRKKKEEEESPTFDFTTPPPPSCGPNRAEKLHLKQYLEGHLGENLFQEICCVVKSGKSAISIMRKVPGGVQRAQHLIPMVRHFCRLDMK